MLHARLILFSLVHQVQGGISLPGPKPRQSAHAGVYESMRAPDKWHGLSISQLP